MTSRENRIKKKMDRGEKGREGKREGEGNRDKKGGCRETRGKG